MLARFGHCLAVPVLLLCLVFFPEVNAQAADPNDALVDECVRGVIARDKQFTPQWVRFTATQFMGALMSKTGKDESTIHVDAEYAIKGEKRRFWCRIMSGTEVLNDWNRETWFIDNGEVMARKDSSEKTYLITRNRKPLNARIAPPLDESGETIVRDSFIRWLAKGGAVGMKASLKPTSGDGPSVIMEWHYPKTKWRSKCSISPSRGYAVEWYEQYDASGKLSRRTSTSEWIILNGTSFPKRVHGASAYEGTNKPSWTIELEVTSLELQSRKIPDSLFQVDFPADAIIYDVDKGTPVRKTELAQTHLDEVVKRIEKPSRNWWLIGSWSAVGAGVLVGLYLFRRRRPAAVS